MSGEITSHVEPMVNPKEAAAIQEAAGKNPVDYGENTKALPAQAPASPAPAELPQSPPEAQPEAPPAELEAVLQPFQEELASTGELSEESIGRLSEQLQVPPELVKFTYEGMRVTRQRRDAEVLQTVGGSEAYQAMVQWASSSYKPEDAEAFNRAIISGTKEEALQAVQQLRQKFTEVNGSFQPRNAPPAPPSVPAQRTAASSSRPSVEPFADLGELMSAQKDARYGKDSRYTQHVYQRASISKL